MKTFDMYFKLGNTVIVIKMEIAESSSADEWDVGREVGKALGLYFDHPMEIAHATD